MTDYALLYVGPDGKTEWSPLPWPGQEFRDGPPLVRAVPPPPSGYPIRLYIPLRKPRA